MPKLTNPTDTRLGCRLGFTLDAGESVEITEEQARELEGTVFVIDRGRRPASDDTSSATPRRAKSRRSAATAEVTDKPAMETRG